MAQRPYETIVDSLLGELLVAQDPYRDAQELAVAAPIDGFDLGTEIASTRLHHLST